MASAYRAPAGYDDWSYLTELKGLDLGDFDPAREADYYSVRYGTDMPRKVVTLPPRTGNGHRKPVKPATAEPPIPAQTAEEVLRDEPAPEKERARQHLVNLNTGLELGTVLPPILAGQLNNRAEAFPVDPIALLGPLLATAASVVGHRCRVEVKVGWSEPLVVWTGNVLQPGALKSPSGDVFANPLRAMQTGSFQSYETAVKGKQDGDSDPPPPRRWIVSDATYERVAEIVAQPSTFGLLSYQDELAQWFASLERATGSGARAGWLTLWSGGACIVDRKVAASSCAMQTAVSLCGNVQPDVLQARIQASNADPTAAGDGLWSRFLWIRPTASPWRWTDAACSIQEQISKLLVQLDTVPSGHLLQFTAESRAVAVPVWNAWAKEAMDTSPARAAFLSKLRGYSVRLAGILHLLDCCEAGDIRKDVGLPVEVVERAMQLSRFFLAQFDAIQGDMGIGDIPADVAAFLRKVKDTGAQEVRPRDVLTWRIWGRENRTTEQALTLLKEVAETYGHGSVVQGKRRDSWVWRPSADK
jgi:hypothetical protein